MNERKTIWTFVVRLHFFFSVFYIQEKRNNERNPHSIGICKQLASRYFNKCIY